MKIVVAVDSFKGSISSVEAGDQIKAGLMEANPHFDVQVAGIADGGEGTVEAVYRVCGGEKVQMNVQGPDRRPVPASFVMLPDRRRAVVELAQASGLVLLGPAERNPLTATTFGTGELVREGVKRGARHVVLAVGGSATNDGGCGVCSALGVCFRNRRGEAFVPAGGTLSEIDTIDLGNVPEEVRRTRISVATDVDNPLCGPRGAAHVYAPQKGASPQQVEVLDRGLRQLAQTIAALVNREVAEIPGSGAAGGVGAALHGLFNADFVSGFSFLSDLIGLEAMICKADLVITGEGKVDSQTLQGKAPLGVARMAKKHGVCVFAVGGSISPDAERLREEGVAGFFPAVPGPVSLACAMENAPEFLRTTARRIGYLLDHFTGDRV